MNNITQELEKIYDEDQNVRNEWEELSKKYGKDSPEMKQHLKLVSQIEETSLKAIEKIINKYDWPSKEIIGTKANYAIWLVIQHSDKDTMLKYENNMEAAYKQGVISKSDYATFKDRLLILQGRKQLYGTQYIFDEKENKYVLEPIENIKKVNIRRKEMELPPLEEELNKED